MWHIKTRRCGGINREISAHKELQRVGPRTTFFTFLGMVRKESNKTPEHVSFSRTGPEENGYGNANQKDKTHQYHKKTVRGCAIIKIIFLMPAKTVQLNSA